MQVVFINGIIWLLMVGMILSQEQCTLVEKNLYDIHGTTLKISIPITITLCNTSVVVKNSPITLASHTNYLKFRSKHIRARKDDDRLPHLYAYTFLFLPDLRSLVISQVDLETIEENSFKGLTNLSYLSLYDNKLRHLPENVFDDLPNLVELNLNSNQLEEINPKHFERLTNLKILRLSINNLIDLPEGVFLHLNQLTYLTFTKNHLNILKSNIFNGLNNLKTLTLISNELGIIEVDAFRNLTNLEKLSLEYNKEVIFGDILGELNNMPSLNKMSLSPDNFFCVEIEAIEKLVADKNVELLLLSKHSETCRQGITDSKIP